MAHIETLEGLVACRLAEKRVSKAELAQLIGVKTTQTLNTKLDGSSELSLREARGLADFCDVSVETIVELALAM